MDFLLGIWNYVVPFVVVLTVLVFVHEMGHYLVARRCGVRVEVFSIGFGKELFGWTARNGTRWKFSMIPFGGYVKMFGEHPPDSSDESDESGDPGAAPPTPEEIADSFYAKTVGQRSAIVFAGPLANFLFAIVVLAGLFSILGQPFTPPDIGKVMAGSAAERAGFKAGDVFKEINGTRIERFEQVSQIIQLAAGRKMTIKVLRDDRIVTLVAIPDAVEVVRFGTVQKIGRLGVTRTTRDMILVRHDPLTAIWRATVHTFTLTANILDALGQIVTGQRTTEELGGPLRIAQISGDMAKSSLIMLVQFAAILSINLGLINLFPIPILDGGHLVFYGIEALRGRPVGERVMGYSLNFGLALILCLTLFVTWNDLIQLRVFEYLIDLVT